MCTCSGRIHPSRSSILLLLTMATNIMKKLIPDAELHRISLREVVFRTRIANSFLPLSMTRKSLCH